jgi:hypothetical protein
MLRATTASSTIMTRIWRSAADAARAAAEAAAGAGAEFMSLRLFVDFGATMGADRTAPA